MRGHSFLLGIWAVLLLAGLTGCRTAEKAAVPAAPVGGTAVSVAPECLPFPIVREADPAEPVLDLDAAQQRDIHTRLALAGVTSPWFGVLTLNRADFADETRRDYEIVVFQRPTTETAEYRLGKSVRLNSLAAAQGQSVLVEEYIQVLEAADARTAPSAVPRSANLPFSHDPKLTVPETIEGYRVARKLGLDGESIAGVEKPDAQSYEVHSCTCSQPDAYRGRWLRTEKNAEGKWAVVEKGIWLD